uniref:RNA-directed RNA polymerase n=1 Tax=Spinach virus 1_Tur TaxID=2977991 RepID=A0A9N6YJ49_9RHAB|nr:TPA_asm: polyprotein [Spinach virus 1_Tur]
MGFSNDTLFEGTVTEKLMTDLHLGNALNLDHVEYLVHGKFDTYPIFITDFQRRNWSHLMELSKYPKDITIGLLEPSQLFLLEDSKTAVIGQTLYKDLLQIIGKSLKERNLNFPLATCFEELVDMDVLCKESYMYMFRFIVEVVCMVSEASRGGTKSCYPNILIKRESVIGSFQFGKTNWTIVANNSFCFLTDNNTRRTYAGSFDSILMIMDVIGQRICLDIGNQICLKGEVPGSAPRETLAAILNIGDQILNIYGNDGYEFIALFEPLVTSIILKNNPDPITDNEEFYRACVQEMKDLIMDGVFPPSTEELFNMFANCLMALDSITLSNIFCLYRIWGHPRVNVYEGMKKVMKKGTEEKMPADHMGQLVLYQFRKMFITEFYSRHHNYPPCTFTTDKMSYIRECIETEIPISLDNIGYNILDFKDLEIEKMWELPETYDVCHILNDKSVSPNRSELHASIKAGSGPMLGTQRRGIIRWLESDSIRCKEFLAYIDKNGLDLDALIIGMYEKEREIKIKARMFSLMSEQMRMYFVLTEEMISDRLLKYFPQITMKDSLNVQTKKLWNVSESSDETSLDPTINIDFEKWNLNMRDEFTHPIFSQMDRMFGYENLIARTHEIFKNSYIYASSGKYLPPISSKGLITDAPMCYIGHLGGMEGLRQKGWTIATVCLLCYIADQYRIKINLLGQGDNQVVRIYMPHLYWANIRSSRDRNIENARNILSKYVDGIENYFAAAGLPIKMRETWKSTRLYMYGKNMYLDGNSLPQWNKKLLRSYALSNEGTLTISGVIGTIATNLCAAAHVSEKPDILYAVFLILGEWSLEYLLAYHPFTRKFIKENDVVEFQIPSRTSKRSFKSPRINRKRLMTTILLIPTAVGGSVTIPLFGFIIRGFPDNATEGYTWLKLLGSVPSRYQDLFENWYSFLPNDSVEFDMLIQAPWSLNHKKPPTPSLRSRDTVREWLTSGEFSGNNFLTNVTKILKDFQRKDICNLLTGNNINPLILNEIYKSFPHVYLDEIIGRVENTRTVKKLSLKAETTRSVIRDMMRFEHEFLGYLYWRGKKKGTVFSNCATRHCREARNVGWRRVIKGLTTPHPIEFAFNQVCSNGQLKCDGSDFIYCKLDPIAKFPPYLGSKVKTKVVSLQDMALRSEPLVVTSAKMVRFASWLNLGPNSMALLRRNMGVVCDIELFHNVEDIETTSYAGCVEHRFNPACASEGCFINYAPQVGRKIFMSSDNMPMYGRGSLNYTLHFQALFCTLQYNAANSKDVSFQHYHISCPDCIVPVDDEIDDIGDFSRVLDHLYEPARAERIRATLGYINKRIQVFEDLVPESLVNFANIPVEDISPIRLRYGIHHSLAVRSAMMIMYSKEETPELIGVDDLQAFPRVYCYKVSCPLIIRFTVEYLFIIKLVRTTTRPSIKGFSAIKEKLKNQLMKMPLNKFKGLASLCVGRTFRMEDGETVPFLNLGEFPEDTTSFLNAVRAEVITHVINQLDIPISQFSIQVPSVGMTGKEELYLLIHSVLRAEKCDACIDNLWRAFREKEHATECPHGHISRARYKVKKVPIPMDSAMKGIQLSKSQIDPIPLHGISAYESVNIFSIDPKSRFIPTREFQSRMKKIVQGIRENFEIRLPTTAIYKWDYMISQISSYRFDHIVIFGDGVGQTSYVCARRFTDALIHPTALLEKKSYIPQDLMSIKPFMSRHFTNVSGALIETVEDDILKPLWERNVIQFLRELEGNILILSDLEGEKGNWMLTRRLLDMIEKSKLNVEILFKVYFHESRHFPQLLFQYTNPYCNGQYLEGFLSTIDLEGDIRDSTEVFSEELWGQFIQDSSLRSLTECKSQAYEEIGFVSKKIATHVLNRNYLTLPKEILGYPKGLLLYRQLKYISMNFMSPFQHRMRDDRRLMLDGTMIRITVGVKMLLAILYGPKILDLEYVKFLRFVKATKRNRLDVAPDLTVVLVQGDEEFGLSKKEFAATMHFRQEFLLSQDEVCNSNMEFPETLGELCVKELYFGAGLWRDHRLYYPDL